MGNWFNQHKGRPMINKIDLVFFDIDGVIFSSKKIVNDAYESSVKQFRKETGIKLNVPSKRAIIREMGKPSHEIICNFFSDLSDFQKNRISTLILENLCKLIYRGKGEIYPGIKNVIERLSINYKLRISSNGRKDYIESILKTYDLEKYFNDNQYVGHGFRDKSEIIGYHASRLGIHRTRAVVIGDRDTDIKAAKKNNSLSIGCEWGHAVSSLELVGATWIAEKPKHILEILL